ncbi:DNA circularization N-terminal domain-containing protein [Gluconobacter frateurii]|uniref:DNA circulation N-terminal domain-containing protein n=1 Tax=Gluconobacter frateurii NRIC 0228 TaxID=1307946 RepID=A0ABQ0Q913_9PROT|nr:DNA circularization N-terminal domain-containing protein [Gluconobacter frateurii]GBR09516.1 hypothetical protein AA0228_0702 [Gluconobacter frateurii NRIC 0228]GLP91935.1 2-hydroxyacid dehydrogenase [Gluconobacter frateurii]
MSGSLSTFGLGSSASVLSQIPGVGSLVGNALSSLLGSAALGGVVFDCLDSREAAGRRVQRFLFPERPVEDQLFQDFGALDAPLHLTGFLSGDDYVIRATRMRKVLLKKGPQTLVHPWWGRLRVRIVEPGEISFSSSQIRLARFSVSVIREPAKSTTGGLLSKITDTLNSLLEKADDLVDEATLAVQGVLAPLAIPLALAGGVNSLISEASGIWDGLTASAPQPIQAAVTTPLATLSAGVSAPADNSSTDYANAVVGAFAGVPVALANAVTDPDESVVAPAQAVVGDTSDTVTAAAIGALLLSGADQIATSATTLAAVSGVPGQVQGVAVAVRAITVSQILACWGGLDFVSGADAIAARDIYLAGLDGLIADLESAASAGCGVSLSGLWTAVRAARIALIADCSAQVGRLPSVVAVTVPAQMSAWTLAYAIAGDDVSQVQTVLDDLVTRNGISHPGAVGPGTVEVLEQ